MSVGKSGRTRKWADFLHSQGFDDAEDARQVVESSSHMPGQIADLRSLNLGTGRVFSYRKRLQSNAMHPELGRNSTLDEILWPRVNSKTEDLPGVTLVLSRAELTNAFAITLGNAIRQDYGG